MKYNFKEKQNDRRPQEVQDEKIPKIKLRKRTPSAKKMWFNINKKVRTSLAIFKKKQTLKMIGIFIGTLLLVASGYYYVSAKTNEKVLLEPVAIQKKTLQIKKEFKPPVSSNEFPTKQSTLPPQNNPENLPSKKTDNEKSPIQSKVENPKTTPAKNQLIPPTTVKKSNTDHVATSHKKNNKYQHQSPIIKPVAPNENPQMTVFIQQIIQQTKKKLNNKPEVNQNKKLTVTLKGANVVKNPGFESGLDHWSSWHPESERSNHSVAYDYPYEGKGDLNHWADKDYRQKTYQIIKDIPDGVYVAKAWIRSSGGQYDATFGVTDFDSQRNEEIASVELKDQPVQEWKQFEINDIHIKGGQAYVFVYSSAYKGNWFDVDKIELFKVA